MLSVKTNRSIEDFKSDVVGGFNLIETVTIVGCVIVYAIIMMILILYSPIPKILCAYVPFPLIVYPIAKTFFKKNGMGIKEFRAKTKAFKGGEILPYKSTENPDNYLNIAKESNSEDSFDKTLRKIKIIAAIGILVLIAAIILVVVLKFVL